MTRILLSALLVLAGVFMSLSTPAMASEWGLVPEDAIMNFPAGINVTGPGATNFKVIVTSPDGREHALSGMTDREGGAEVEFVPRGKAGVYRLGLEVAGRIVHGLSESLHVFHGAPAQFSLETDGIVKVGKESTLFASVRDTGGNPLPGRQLIVVASVGEVKGSGKETNIQGTAQFSFHPEGGGKVTVKVVDVDSGEGAKFTIDVLDDAVPKAATIRASLLEEFERDEEEEEEREQYGYVDHFEVRIRQDQEERKVVAVNRPLDLHILALDRKGRRVKDYVGNVVIETTDINALAPLQSLRFLPSHHGLLERPLALVFSTTGLQTIRVYDEEEPEIEGSTDLRVVGSDRPLARGSIVIEAPAGMTGPQAVVRGKTDAYLNLEVLDNGKVVAAGESDAGGAFSFSLTLDPTVPSHEIVVREGEGGLDRVSTPLVLTVDTIPPGLRGETLTLLPETVAPGGNVTLSVTAEAGQTVAASIASAQEHPLMEGAEKTEEGWGMYSGTLPAPTQPGSYPVTVVVRDSASNASRATKTLTVAAGNLPVVQGVQVRVAESGVQMTWLPIEGAVSYRIYFGVNPADFSSHIDMSAPATSVRLTGLSPGETTYFAVTALGAGGEESAQRSAIVAADIPGSLFALRATSLVNGVRLQWSAPAGAEIRGYRLEYGVEPGITLEQRIFPPHLPQAELMDLINGVEYYFSLSALQEDGKLLVDPRVISITPGKGGKPGLHLAPRDPLPFSLGGAGGPGSPHPSAPLSLKSPPRTPRSGFPLPSLTAGLLLAGGPFIVRGVLQRRRERQVLCVLKERYHLSV